MKISKKIVSLIAALALVACMSVTALATNEADNDLGMANVTDKVAESTVSAEGVEITGAIPEGVSVSIGEVSESEYAEGIGDAVEGAEVLFAQDIDMSGDWQPEEGETVTVKLDAESFGLENGAHIGVIHEHDGDLVNLGEYVVADGELSFETGGFSDFYFYLVFERDGYSYTLSGGGEVYLSELLDSLGIGRSVADVESVSFSNEELLSIERAGSDWLLTSIVSFGSKESLAVTFADGEVIEILVTDPVIYNYAVGPDITNVPLLDTTNVQVDTVSDGDKYAEGKTYKVNTVEFTTDDIKANGVAAADVTEPPALTTVHMRIYVEPGMAIRFKNNIYFTAEGSKPTYDDNNIWFWAYSSTQTCNYVIIKENTAGTTTTFRVQNNSVATEYCNVQLCVVEKTKNPVLLETVIEDAPGNYSIKNIPVTLYDYDGAKWNQYYDAKGKDYLSFAGTVEGVVTTDGLAHRSWTTSGQQANGGGSVALMGIVKDTLVNGLPEMSQGQQVDLFSKNSNPDAGKTVYNNVGFQFIYNEDTGYYSYNAAYNHAQFNSAENEIQLYKQSLSQADIPTGGTSQHGNAGFYPFADINKSFTNPGYEEIGWDEWAAALVSDTFTYIPSACATDIVDSTSKDPVSTAKLHYGLQVDSQFYMPEGKKLNGEELVYKFTGDDDLWVFIDGELVLDIGGGHTHVAGSFNLTTGEVKINNYSKLEAADGGYYEKAEYGGTNLSYINDFLTRLEDDQMHRIQIFYLERHAGISNCKMHFNLPLVPSDAVEVSKSLDLASADGSRILKENVTPSDGDYGNEFYTFQVFTAADDEDNVDAAESEFAPLRDAEYTVGADVYRTDENGRFQIKAGQTAYFLNIPRFTEVYAVELTPNASYDYDASKATVSVNGASETSYQYGSKSETKVMKKGEAITFNFTNVMLAQNLIVEKSGIDPIDDDWLVNHDDDAANDVKTDDAEYQSTIYNVVGPDGFSMSISIHSNNSVTIRDLVPGMYTVTEDAGWSWRYTPAGGPQQVVLTNETGIASFANSRTKALWLNGDNWCANLFAENGIRQIFGADNSSTSA